MARPLPNPFERAIKAGPDWESRRENLMNKLTERVQGLSNFINDVRAIGGEPDLEETREALEEAYQRAVAKLPPTVKAKRVALQKLEQEESKLEAEYGRFPKDALMPGHIQEKAWLENTSRYSLVNKRKARLLSDPDTAYLYDLHKTIQGLVAKRVAVLQQKTDIDAIQALRAHLSNRTPVEDSDIEGIKRFTFNITFYIKNELMDKIRDSETAGIHFSGTPFNAVRSSSKRAEMSILHEGVHNLIDHARHLRHRMPADSIEDTLMELKKFASKDDGLSGLRKPIIQDRLSVFLGKLDPGVFLNDLHNEILAEIENVESSGFKSDTSGLIDDQDLILKEIFKHFSIKRWPENIFATAGRQVSKLRKLSDLLKEFAENESFITIFEKFSGEVKDNFYALASSLEKGFAMLRFLEPVEALALHDELLALCVVQKPKHLARSMQSYLDHRLGSERTHEFRRWLLAENKGLETKTGLEYVSELLAGGGSIPRGQTEILRGLLIDVKDKIPEGLDILVSNIDDLEDVRGYVQLLHNVGQKVGLIAEQIKNSSLKILSQHAFCYFEQHVSSGFANLAEHLSSLDSLEREGYLEALDLYLLNEFFLSDASDIYDTDTAEQIVALPHWAELERAGLGDAARSYRERMQASLSSEPSNS